MNADEAPATVRCAAGPASRVAALALCFAVSFASAASASRHQPPPRASLIVSVDGGRLSLDAREAPIESVLRAIAGKGGFTLDVTGSLRGKVSDSFKRLPLDRAIRRLLYSLSFIIELDSQETAGGGRGIRRLVVFARTGGAGRGRATPGPKRRTADAGRAVSKAKARLAMLSEVHRLGRTRSEAAMQSLLGLLHDDADPVVRTTAAKVLARFGRKPVVGALMSALGDPAVSVRRRAIVSLGRIGGARVVGKLIAIVQSRGDWQDQVLAAQGLSRHRTERARQALTKATDHPDSRVAKAVRAGLRRFDRMGDRAPAR